MKTMTLLATLILSGNALAFNFASPSEPSAKIILSHSNAAKQIFPVKLLMVNGENINVRSDAVWLSPGEYELRLGAFINKDYTKQI